MPDNYWQVALVMVGLLQLLGLVAGLTFRKLVRRR